MEPGSLLAERYRLDHRIGAGGMGSVWHATDTLLDRAVAVKVLHRGLDRPRAWRDRFEREARTVASLDGDWFTEVYDLGETSDGDAVMPFIVMEFVDGSSLSALLASGPLPPDRTMRIVAGVAEALDEVHRNGIVHRDIKPGNILVGAEDRVRLVDFGIATLSDASALTTTGTVLGTVTYVAPEQIADREVTSAADFYSLGVVAYECLTGRPPFESDHLPGVLHAHLNLEPPALPATVPPAVAEVVTCALRKEPVDRWGSGAELAEACRAAIDAGTTVPLNGRREAAAPKRTAPMPPLAAAPVSTGPTAVLHDRATSGEERQPRRRRRNRLLLLAVPIVLVFPATTTLIMSPWDGWGPDEGPVAQGIGADPTATASGTGGGTDPSTAAASTGAPTSAVAETPAGTESSAAQLTEEADTPDDDADGAPEEPDPVEAAPESGQVPNIGGMSASAARDLLEAQGFQLVTLYNQAVSWIGLQPGQCEVVAQEPAAGTTAAYTAQIRVGYYVQVGANDDCA
ncbi:protein kinase [Glycomyces sp. NPDC047010]|uniref:serine/threonine-protein kinase n=1 Tax=Glycomyces sp. NPDC047010 TaxID=3155023 RepID=UPI0033E63223